MGSKILLFVALIAITASQQVSYDGYKVFRVTPKTEVEVAYVKSLEKSGVDFWTECVAPGRYCDIMLSPQQQTESLEQLSDFAVDVLIEDVGRIIKLNKISSGRISWDSYYRLDAIYDFLEEQAAMHRDIASVHSIGKSVERRVMNLIRIANPMQKKPIIFVEANVHAREHITNAVATYLINELLNSQDPEIQSWTQDFDWHVLPVFNVDGFEYSMNTDRMWRKNRNNTSSVIGCKGIDLNRNFDYNWGGPGASPEPCSETFAGTGPNSEPEVQALAAYVETLSDDLVFYLSVHSYSQFIMFPYGDGIDSSIYESHMRIATEAADAARVRHGTIFTPGNWLEILYPSTGVSVDFFKSKLNVSLGLTYELRDTGRYGFLLPPDQIIPSSEEFMDSLKPIINALRNGFP